MGKSFFWIRQAAEQGHASSQNSLGLCYLHGKGVPRDRGEAFKWFLKAAEQGDPLACNNVAFCYFIGYGVEGDKEKGRAWVRKAEEWAPAVSGASGGKLD